MDDILNFVLEILKSECKDFRLAFLINPGCIHQKMPSSVLEYHND